MTDEQSLQRIDVPSSFSTGEDFARSGRWFKFWIADADMLRLERGDLEILRQCDKPDVPLSTKIAVLAWITKVLELK